ncbi:hypothetical protein F183_A31280 [Bryobacterales bacterium F-183]|nr:hypothetical protein F183_A31280 [Bryobacterales bacterium F-183]
MRLLEFQRVIAASLMSGESGAAKLIRPSARLTAAERLEIYQRSYWFRLRDALAEDFPGLRAVVGKRRFVRLTDAYLRECPSRSFTLRDLGSQLVCWLEAKPELLGPRAELALDMARLEWAHIEAFDGAAEPLLDPERLQDLRAGLQPYVTLLALHYAVDALRVRVDDGGADRKVGRVRRQELYVAVHRVDGSVYYRRLEREEFRILEGLRQGRSIAAAIDEGFAGSRRDAGEIAGLIEQWFANWSRLGWLTGRTNTKRTGR